MFSSYQLRRNFYLTLSVLLILFFSSPNIYGQYQRIYTKNGTVAGDKFGQAVDGDGDLNGDGKDDFIISTHLHDTLGLTDVGAIYAFSGTNGSLLFKKIGAEGTFFGHDVAIIEDVNNDNKADFIVGAFVGGVNGYGAVYLYSGTGSLLDSINNPNTWGNGLADQFGYTVGRLGKINDTTHFIIGAYKTDSAGVDFRGAAYVYYFNGTSSTLRYRKIGDSQADFFGYAVGGVGDLNNDGKADFAVGAPQDDPNDSNEAGSVYFYSGSNGNLLFRKDGAKAGDWFGGSVDGAGDVNGDGKSDVIIGAPFTDSGSLVNAGSATVYSGTDTTTGVDGTFLYRKYGQASNDRFGYAVDGAGDGDWDEYDEFIVGAPLANPGSPARTDAGSAYIYAGVDGSLMAQVDGAAAGDEMGWAVAGAGDINADDGGDFILSAYETDPGGLDDAGSAFVYRARPVDLVGPKVITQLPTFDLGQNYPNPFNPSTSIAFSLAAESQVELEVFNILGEKVRTLVNETRAAGNYEVIFDGRDEKGKPLSSGTYFYRLTAGDKKVTKQMTLLK